MWDKSLIVVLSLLTVEPAWAQTTNPNPPPTAPPSVTFPQVPTPPAQCAQQLTNAISTANTVGLTANGVGATAQVVGLTAQQLAADARAGEFAVMAPLLAVDIPAIGSASGAAVPAAALGVTTGIEALALIAAITGAGSTVAGVASQARGVRGSGLVRGRNVHGPRRLWRSLDRQPELSVRRWRCCDRQSEPCYRHGRNGRRHQQLGHWPGRSCVRRL
jgi:hypothetical protein